MWIKWGKWLNIEVEHGLCMRHSDPFAGQNGQKWVRPHRSRNWVNSEFEVMLRKNQEYFIWWQNWKYAFVPIFRRYLPFNKPLKTSSLYRRSCLKNNSKMIKHCINYVSSYFCSFLWPLLVGLRPVLASPQPAFWRLKNGPQRPQSASKDRTMN